MSSDLLLMAVAVNKRNPDTAASPPSPTKSPPASSVIVASLPLSETTVRLARPCRRKNPSLSGPLGEEVLSRL